MTQAPLIMIIRHGEKPTPAADGINEAGKKSDNDLIVAGWQRAGALIRFFAPLSGQPADPRLAQPRHLIAAYPKAPGADQEEKSKREEQTLTPLAAAMGLPLNLDHGVGEEEQVATLAMQQDGPVLIAWEHKRLTKLARAITSSPDLPAAWPSDRFDMVYVLRRQSEGGGYDFEQIPELLLPGDSAEPFPV